MPMVRPMSRLAAVLQTCHLADSLGVRQQYPVLFVLALLYALGIGIGSVVLMVLAGLRAHQGKYFDYPVTFWFLRDNMTEA